MPKMKPKSMWIMWPSMSISMLPLCLSFSFNTYVNIDDPAKDRIKLLFAEINFCYVLNTSA